MDDAHAKEERRQPPARSSSLRRLLRATSTRSSPSPSSPASPRSNLSSPLPRVDPRTPPTGFASSLQDLPRRLLNQGNSASRHRYSQEQRQPTPSTLRNTSPLTQSSTPSSTRPSRLSLPPSSSPRNSPADATSPATRHSLLSPVSRRPPTSLSANGIATSNGPPVALLTRRKSNNVLRVSHLSPRVPSVSSALSPDTPTYTASYQNYKLARKISQSALAQPNHNLKPLSSRVKSLPASRATSPLPRIKRTRSVPGLMESDNQSDYDFACSHNGQPEQHTAGSGAEKASSSEDLFLHIAQDSPQQDGDDDTVKLERRKVSQCAVSTLIPGKPRLLSPWSESSPAWSALIHSPFSSSFPWSHTLIRLCLNGPDQGSHISCRFPRVFHCLLLLTATPVENRPFDTPVIAHKLVGPIRIWRRRQSSVIGNANAALQARVSTAFALLQGAALSPRASLGCHSIFSGRQFQSSVWWAIRTIKGGRNLSGQKIIHWRRHKVGIDRKGQQVSLFEHWLYSAPKPTASLVGKLPRNHVQTRTARKTGTKRRLRLARLDHGRLYNLG